MKFAYLTTLDTAPEGYDEAARAIEVFAELGVEMEVFDLKTQPLPNRDDYAGVVLGECIAPVRDETEWRDRLIEWLMEDKRYPVLGIGNGHQILALAHEATVGPLEEEQIGVYRLTMEGVEGFNGYVFQCHEHQVHHAPRGARLWARDSSGVQAVWYDQKRWSVQFRPLFNKEIAKIFGKKYYFPEDLWDDERTEEGEAGGRALVADWLGMFRRQGS